MIIIHRPLYGLVYGKKILEKYEIAILNTTDNYEENKFKKISNVRKNIGKLTYE